MSFTKTWVVLLSAVAFSVAALPLASAVNVECQASTAADVPLKGTRTAEVEGGCAGDAVPRAHAGADAVQDRDGVVANNHVGVDFDGGGDDLGAGGDVFADCPPPDERALLGQIVCGAIEDFS